MPTAPSDETSTALALFGVQAGPRFGEEIPLRSPVLTIGQGPQNAVVLEDDSVSRTHARLEYEAGSWLLTDLDSTNGTWVEGTRLAPRVPTPLTYGAAVRFGGVRLHFRQVEKVDLDAARASYVPPSTAASPLRPARFRLPLWVLVLILVAIALALFLFLDTPVMAAEGFTEILEPGLVESPPEAP